MIGLNLDAQDIDWDIEPFKNKNKRKQIFNHTSLVDRNNRNN